MNVHTNKTEKMLRDTADLLFTCQQSREKAARYCKPSVYMPTKQRKGCEILQTFCLHANKTEKNAAIYCRSFFKQRKGCDLLQTFCLNRLHKKLSNCSLSVTMIYFSYFFTVARNTSYFY